MRALTLVAPETVEIVEVPDPRPAAGEVVVEIEGCGLCGSNLPPWQGRPWFEYPFEPGAPGHEGWGRVVELGEGVDSVALGSRVALLSYRALAEYDRAAASALVPLPEALDGAAVPGEALGCAFNVFRRSDIRPGQTVAVVGLGFLGALLTQLAAGAGARVIAISRRPFALEIGRRMGASETLSLGACDEHDDELVAAVAELTGGSLCERVIEAVGKQRALDLASALTGTRGRLVLAGYHQDGPRQVDMQAWNWRGLDVINAHERDPAVYVAGMRAAIDAIASGRVDPSPLYTHSLDFEHAAEAFAALAERPAGFMKAQVSP